MYSATLRPHALAHQCEKRGFTVDELTRLMKMSKATFYRVYNGDTAPSSQFIASLAVVFGTDALSTLVHFGDENTTAPTSPPRGFAPITTARLREPHGDWCA